MSPNKDKEVVGITKRAFDKFYNKLSYTEKLVKENK